MTPREIISELLEHFEVLYADESSDSESAEAIIEMERIVGRAIARHVDKRTEALRGALADMLAQHSKKVTMKGACTCSACVQATKAVGGGN